MTVAEFLAQRVRREAEARKYAETVLESALEALAEREGYEFRLRVSNIAARKTRDVVTPLGWERVVRDAARFLLRERRKVVLR